MNDMSRVIEPRSDQVNADDFLAGPQTFTIVDVIIKGGQEQPVSIKMAGTDKFFRPCKSMSRVLVQAWGPDASKYKGRSLTLYRDPTVKWAGMEIGGIRISHMSDIEGTMTMALTATKGSRKPFVVKPLAPQQATPETDPRAKAEAWTAEHIERIRNATNTAELDEVHQSGVKALVKLAKEYADLNNQVVAAFDQRINELADAVVTAQDETF
jgi:hypothetical protein